MCGAPSHIASGRIMFLFVCLSFQVVERFGRRLGLVVQVGSQHASLLRVLTCRLLVGGDCVVQSCIVQRITPVVLKKVQVCFSTCHWSGSLLTMLGFGIRSFWELSSDAPPLCLQGSELFRGHRTQTTVKRGVKDACQRRRRTRRRQQRPTARCFCVANLFPLVECAATQTMFQGVAQQCRTCLSTGAQAKQRRRSVVSQLLLASCTETGAEGQR